MDLLLLLRVHMQRQLQQLERMDLLLLLQVVRMALQPPQRQRMAALLLAEPLVLDMAAPEPERLAVRMGVRVTPHMLRSPVLRHEAAWSTSRMTEARFAPGPVVE
jgi:hypothetical protein